MYSFIVMATLGTSVEVPDFCFLSKSCSTSCNGCSTCSKRSGGFLSHFKGGHGCSRKGFGSHWKGMFCHRKTCNSTCSHCATSTCYGGTYTCANYTATHAVAYGVGAYTSWYGGACAGYYPHWFGACFGGNGCAGSLWGNEASCAVPVIIIENSEEKKDKDKGPEKMPPATSKKSNDNLTFVSKPNYARLIVHVPADAIFYMDGHKMKSKGTRRTFRTPELETGKEFFYNLKVEVFQQGKLQSKTRRVQIKAGDELTIHFEKLDRKTTVAIATK